MAEEKETAGVGVLYHDRVVLPGVVLVVVAIAWGTFDFWVDFLVGMFPDRIAAIGLLRRLLVGVTWLAGAWIFIRFAKVYFWHGLLERRSGRPVPVLMTDIFAGLVVAVALVAVLISAFEVPPAMVGAMAAAAILLVGLFLKGPLEDLFSGLSLNVDPSISIGDLVRLESGEIGRIVEITWRSTRLETEDGNIVLVPNSVIGKSVLMNYSEPKTTMRGQIRVTLDFAVSIDRAIRVLQAAARSACSTDGLVMEPRPQVSVAEPGSHGIVYEVGFFFDFRKINEEMARTEIVRQTMTHLFNAGLALAQPKQNVFLGRVRMRQMDWMREPDRKTLIRSNPLFGQLGSEDIEILTRGVNVHRFRAGDTVIEQGDEGATMFGIAEGLVEVHVRTDETENVVKVAELVPGALFGEMSLLAGEPRSATVSAVLDSVIYEITRDSVMELLDRRPEIGEILSRIVATRQVENSLAIESASKAEMDAAISSAADNLFERMRTIFSGVLGRRKVEELRPRA